MNPLGQKTEYKSTYDPSLLYVIPRSIGREKIGINHIPFEGTDFWTAYEVSCLDNEGKPLNTIIIFEIPSSTKFIVESKSLKLYLNSFNNTKLENLKELYQKIHHDLNFVLGSDIRIHFCEKPPLQVDEKLRGNLDLINLENVDTHVYNPSFLVLKSNKIKQEYLHTSLFKSNCPVTGQPDWAHIGIEYVGREIDKEFLLRYLLSFRNHDEFHEQCVERIFWDVNKILQPEKLSVFARYTRRGGLDINPYRSNFGCKHSYKRTLRQ